MLLHVPNVLTREQVAWCRSVMDRAEWVDGKVTAGYQSAQAKRNEQLPEDGEAARQLGDVVLTGLRNSPLFMSVALPNRIFPPLFNRYAGGMSFGNHVDNAIRQVPGAPVKVRTDVSTTLFLSDPDEYDGGELVIDDTYGSHTAKLPAGDAIVYPSTSLHRVTEVTRGARVACFFWTQSLIRDDAQRALLFDLDQSIIHITATTPDNPALLALTACYHNLLRMWSDT